MSTSHTTAADLARQHGRITAADVVAHGISRNVLYDLCRDGILIRSARGVYRHAETPVTAHALLADVARRVPRSVICLLSALVFHEVTTQLPPDVWIALPRGSWRPALSYPPLHVTYNAVSIHTCDVETHRLDGTDVRVYSLARTIADCFKHRSVVGLDVALDALKEGWSTQRVSMDDLMAAATVTRVSRVMRPYLEAIA